MPVVFLGVTHPTITAYMNGERAIDSGKLYQLAGYFKVPFDCFFQSKQTQPTLMFRADNPAENFKEDDRRRIAVKMREYQDFVAERQNVTYLPQQYVLKPEGKKLNSDENAILARVANEQRKIMGIEDEIPSNYYEVFARNNIHVLAFPLETSALSGCSCIDPQLGSVIFINTNEDFSEERQLFSLAHEYGHILLHRNEYAQFFLMPPHIMRACMENPTFQNEGRIRIQELKHYFKVSYVALIMALHDYGYITDVVSRQQWKLMSQKGYNNAGREAIRMKKLTRMKVINWHSFHNETLVFGDSVLLSGENGAGKSTLLDAMQFVITASKNHFNKAAHEHGKRKLSGYVRYKTGKENRPYERTGQVTAHVALEFYDESKKNYFIVGAVVDSASEDSESTMWYRMENIELRDDLFLMGAIPKNIDLFRSTNKSYLKMISKTQIDARKDFKSRFGRLEDKFFELIPKALAFKPIDDIKDFVYAYVLDKKEVNIEALRENVRTYQEFEVLLNSVKVKLQKLEVIRERYRQISECLRKDTYYEYYIARAQVELNEEEIRGLEEEKVTLMRSVAVAVGSAKDLIRIGQREDFTVPPVVMDFLKVFSQIESHGNISTAYGLTEKLLAYKKETMPKVDRKIFEAQQGRDHLTGELKELSYKIDNLSNKKLDYGANVTKLQAAVQEELKIIQEGWGKNQMERGIHLNEIQNNTERRLELEKKGLELNRVLGAIETGLREAAVLCRQEYERILKGKGPAKLKEDYENTKKGNLTKEENLEKELLQDMSRYKSEHDFGGEASLRGYPAFEETYDKLKSSELLEYEGKVQKAKQAAEEEFREQFLSKLQEV